MPPSAAANRPSRRAMAPVNAPRSWPNSSLSSRVSASDAQCTLMYGRPARGLAAGFAAATSSLPVPDSPVMSTVEGVGAIFSMMLKMSRMRLDCPTI